MSSGAKGWIGVDLDGTLAEYHGWQGVLHIGAPVKAMVDRIRSWMADGYEVRVFTARVAPDGTRGMGPAKAARAIQDWLEEVCNLPRLRVTCIKDFSMVELWDDRAVTVEFNTGRAASGDALSRGLA